jgi:hypothetical protein
VDDYFESIARQFEAKIRSLGGRDYALGLGLMVLVSALTMILAVIGHGIDQNSHSPMFGLTKLWENVFFSAASLMVLGGLGTMIALERDTRNLKKGLPQAQMRFALCYRLVTELRYFQNDELPRHLEEALKLWKILFMYLYWMLNPSREQLMLSRKQRDTSSGREQPPISHRRLPTADFPIALELERFSSSYPWLRVSPDSKVIILGFTQVHIKISARLRDGVDVPRLTEVLNHLLVFFFSLIPAKMADPKTAKQGYDELLAFAQDLDTLSPYPETTRPSLFSRIASTFYSAPEAFAHENALVRAVAWYVPVMTLYSLGMLIARWRIPDLDFKGVLISSWISVPLTVAVGAAVAMARRR